MPSLFEHVACQVAGAPGVQVLRNMYIPSGNMWWGNEFNKKDGPVKITTKRKNNILCKKQTCSIKWFISTYSHNYDV